MDLVGGSIRLTCDGRAHGPQDGSMRGEKKVAVACKLVDASAHQHTVEQRDETLLHAYGGAQLLCAICPFKIAFRAED